jgi:hypothetical protein
MKRLTLLLGALLLTAAALAQTAVPPTVRIAHGPYVLNVTEDGFTVVWDAKADAIGWVELAPMDGSHFYSAERPRYYDSHLGLCRVGRMHWVRIEGLQPGTTYRYRIMQRGIVLNEGNRRVILDDGDGSEVYRRKPYTIRTLDPAQEKVDFWMVNDIHARDSVFQLQIAIVTFLFRNGFFCQKIPLVTGMNEMCTRLFHTLLLVSMDHVNDFLRILFGKGL